MLSLSLFLPIVLLVNFFTTHNNCIPGPGPIEDLYPCGIYTQILESIFSNYFSLLLFMVIAYAFSTIFLALTDAFIKQNTFLKKVKKYLYFVRGYIFLDMLSMIKLSMKMTRLS